MHKGRLEAFSDGVIAIIITIMVLELKAPEHAQSLSDLIPLLPVFLSYVLSFVYVAIYWNNHHHMLQATREVGGAVLWANVHLLFWLSLIPFATAWMGQNEFAAAPTAVYGVVLLLCALSYFILQNSIISIEGPESRLAIAVGHDRKGKISLLLYVVAIGLAFIEPFVSNACYLLVAGIWLIPDRRIERSLRPG